MPLRIDRVDASRIRVSGPLGIAEATAALARSHELHDGAVDTVAVDIAGLERVDSATLAVLIAWAARARRAGVKLRFAGIPAGLAALAQLCDAIPLLGAVD